MDIEHSQMDSWSTLSLQPTFSSVSFHILTTSYRNILGTVKLEEVKESHMKICDNPYNLTAGIYFNLPLLHESAPLSVTMKDDESCNIQILHYVPQGIHGEE